MILIANIGKLQGGLTAVPSANPEDGLLTVAVVEAGSVSAWVKLLWRLVRGHRADDARVRTIEARKLEITSDPAMPVELDGDVFDETRSFSVEVLPSALKLRVPRGVERAVS